MNRYIFIFIVIMIVSALLLPAHPFVRCANSEDFAMPAGSVICTGSAYTADPDPKGVNVRLAPHNKASILDVIPYDPEGTSAELSAAHENWVLINSAEGVSSDFRFQGKGWVYAPLLVVRAEHRSQKKNIPLYREPHLKSSVIKMLVGSTETRLTGCKGLWRRVTAGKHKGWLAPYDYCGNPVTTCP